MHAAWIRGILTSGARHEARGINVELRVVSPTACTIRESLQRVSSKGEVLEIGEFGDLSWQVGEFIAVEDELGEGPAVDDLAGERLQLVALNVQGL